MNSLFFDCSTGISGDMIVASLIDAGADKNILQSALDSIPVTGFKTEIKTVVKNAISVCDFYVILEEENHDHDMNYLFGQNENNQENHLHHHHEHEHEHRHEHSENHSHHKNHHEHRSLYEINSIIEKTKITENAKNLAKKIFDILAVSESKAHNVPKEEVHFHEVGAVDSIVDIIACSVCFDNLNIQKVYSTPLTEGTGQIQCAHGLLNIPVPAVLNILQEYKFPLSIKNEHKEFITPTGAAFLASVNPIFDMPQNFTIQKTGFGAGKREYKNPSILRAMLINENPQNDSDKTNLNESDSVIKLECNIDDCTGENLGFVQEKLFETGAKDVTVIPCFMKKNRPAFLLQVLCDELSVSKIESVIFEHTTTIGIRRVKMERTILKRKQVVLQTEYGTIECKEVIVNGKKRISPEYESVKKICNEKNISFVEVIKCLKS